MQKYSYGIKKSLLALSAFAMLGLSACTKCPECQEANCPVANCPTCPGTEVAAGTAAAQTAGTPLVAGAEEIVLPKPVGLSATLYETLENRRSVRAYTDEALTIEDVSNLLWSANGINRTDGKRTAPSARNRQSVSIYAIFPQGAYRYDHVGHKLVRVSNADVRPLKLAPMELLFTSNAEDVLIRGIDAGTASQNAALYCSAANLGTVIRMYRDPESTLPSALKLQNGEHILFSMAVGREKK
ncbi:MAG: nitroreductase family protein [Proteobacteria bacterium]|nr:nitroreductase family protein [Pseudomonadota bacterium]